MNEPIVKQSRLKMAQYLIEKLKVSERWIADKTDEQLAYIVEVFLDKENDDEEDEF